MLKYITIVNVFVFFVLILLLLFCMGVNRDYHYYLSPILFVIPFVYLLGKTPYIYVSKLCIILFSFIPIVVLSSFNFFDFKNIYEVDYLHYITYSLIIYIYPLAIYNFLINRKDRIYFVIFLFYIYWAVSVAYFLWVYIHMQQQFLDRQAFNAFYYVLMPLPVLLILDNRKIHYIVIFTTLIVCILSIKRSAIISILLILLVILFNEYKNSHHKIKYILVIFGLSCIISYLFIDLGLLDRLIILSERFENLSNDGGSGRLDIINNYFSNMHNDDFVQILIGKGFMATKEQYIVLESLHNDWLEVFNSYGIIGMFLLLVFFVTLFIKVCRSYNTSLFLSYSSLFILFLLYSLVGGSFYFVFLSFPLFAAIPVADSISKLKYYG